jgi:hypothetical protein
MKKIILTTIIAASSINAMDNNGVNRKPIEPVYITTSSLNIIASKETEILECYLPLGLILDRIAAEKCFPNCFIAMFYSEKYAANGGSRTGIMITDERGNRSFAVMTNSDQAPSVTTKTSDIAQAGDLFYWHVEQYMCQKNSYYLAFNS